MPTTHDLVVRRAGLADPQLRAREDPALAAGEARLAVSLFALTANNVTYGVAGDTMKYWDFFPAPDGFGRIPVWGFADVVESRADGVAEGERVYGYLPMSTHLVVTPGRVQADGFTDMAAHRQPMAAVYNQYQRVASDPLYRPDAEPAICVLRPLFTTGFVIADLFADNGFYGAETVFVLSASSKTALGAADGLRAMKPAGVRIVGVTSDANAAFVARTGLYDEVRTYRDAAAGVARGRAASIDLSGDARTLASLHAAWGDRLAFSLRVGMTHWTAAGQDAAFAGPKPVWFFAPDQIRKRHKEWGADGFARRAGEAWARFAAGSRTWLRYDERRGGDAIAQAFADVRDGRVPPDMAVVCRW